MPGHPAAGPAPELAGSRPLPHRLVWAIALAAGIVAGLISWLGGELALGAFRPRLYRLEMMGMTSLQPTRESQDAADLKNATLAFTVLGSVTGLVMGLAGGLAGRAPGRGVFVALALQALGALVGALASLALLPLFYRGNVPDPSDLLSPILIHGGVWMAIGAVGGLAFALGLGSRGHLPNAVGAACIAAFLAAIVFHLLNGVLFPDSSSMEPVARSRLVRLLAMLLVTILVALGAARGALGRLPSPSHGSAP